VRLLAAEMTQDGLDPTAEVASVTMDLSLRILVI
jgi:hypothetical protein